MRAAVIVTLSLLALPAIAADVYRSIDSQGNVIYSDRPEDASSVKVAITTVTGRSAPRVGARNSNAALEQSAAVPDEATIAAAEAAQEAEDRAANCKVARERNVQYAQSHRLYRVGANGEREYLSDAELSQARVDAEADVARWCN